MPAIFSSSTLEKTKKQGLLDILLRAIGTNKDEVSDFLKEFNFAMEAYPPTAELYAVPKATVKLAPKIVESMAEAKEYAPIMSMVLTPKTLNKFKERFLKIYENLKTSDELIPFRQLTNRSVSRRNYDYIHSSELSDKFIKALAYVKTRHPELTKNMDFSVFDEIDSALNEPSSYTGFYFPDLNEVSVVSPFALDPAAISVKDLIRILKHEISHSTDPKALKSVVGLNVNRGRLREALSNYSGRFPYFQRLGEIRSRKNEFNELLKSELIDEVLDLPSSEKFKTSEISALRSLRNMFEDLYLGKKNLEYLRTNKPPSFEPAYYRTVDIFIDSLGNIAEKFGSKADTINFPLTGRKPNVVLNEDQAIILGKIEKFNKAMRDKTKTTSNREELLKALSNLWR